MSPRARTRAFIEYMTVSIENLSILGDFYQQQAVLASVDSNIHLGCGVAQLVVRRLAVRQARVRFSARHPMEALLLLSEEAMRKQEDRPRRMVKDERMYDCTV